MEKSLLKKLNWILAASGTLVGIMVVMGSSLIFGDTPSHPESPPAIELNQPDLVKRGEYLVNTSACNDCHSPKRMTPLGPEPDPARLLSGYPSDAPLPRVNKEALKDWVLFNQDLTGIAGPWGVSFAANITSDETGIGNWSEDQFFMAIRHGKYKGLEGSRNLLPPMPWQVYRNMTDQDLRSIFAYLKTTTPIRNIVPAPIPPTEIQ
jgi:hypothetical protein